MFYRTRLAWHGVRTLVWLPFHLLSYRRVMLLLLLAGAWLAYPDKFAFGFIMLPIWLVLMLLGRLSWILRPGARPTRPERAPPAPQPIPVALAGPADTRAAGHSPRERDVLMRLPAGLRRFLDEERAASHAQDRSS